MQDLKPKLIQALTSLQKKAQSFNSKSKYIYSKILKHICLITTPIYTLHKIPYIGPKIKQTLENYLEKNKNEDLENKFDNENKINLKELILHKSSLKLKIRLLRIRLEDLICRIKKVNHSSVKISIGNGNTTDIEITDIIGQKNNSSFSIDNQCVNLSANEFLDPINFSDIKINQLELNNSSANKISESKFKDDELCILKIEKNLNNKIEISREEIQINESNNNIKLENNNIKLENNNFEFNNCKLNNDYLNSSELKSNYIPAFRSGGYAILKVLNEEEGLTKQQVCVRGTKFSDSDFNLKMRYSAFSSMKTLINKKLVYTESKPTKYFLTQQGRIIANKLPENELIIENNEKIKLIIDSREMKNKKERSFFQKELESRNLFIETTNLEVGDFVWSQNKYILDYIVERKKGSDFIRSIADGRLKEQLNRLKNSGIKNIIYLIEGLNKQTNHQLALLSELKNEILVIETKNINESVEVIYKLDLFIKNNNLVHSQMTYETFISLNKKNENLKSILLKSILSIKGFNKEKSVLIANDYESLHEFINKLRNWTDEDSCKYGISKLQIQHMFKAYGIIS